MLMPETPMYLNNGPVSRKYDIRVAWEGAVVEAVSESVAV